ncbi:hypothetical protein K440107A6_04250 [Lawsonibacter asaccharolyticus]
MCTAATYKTKDFYMGRTLDYEFSYGEQITITPRNYEFDFRFAGKIKSHYALIGMAFVAGGYPLYYDAVNCVHRSAKSARPAKLSSGSA